MAVANLTGEDARPSAQVERYFATLLALKAESKAFLTTSRSSLAGGGGRPHFSSSIGDTTCVRNSVVSFTKKSS